MYLLHATNSDCQHDWRLLNVFGQIATFCEIKKLDNGMPFISRVHKSVSKKKITKTIWDSMNHARLPKEVLPE